ncbi:MAG: TIGR00725 family protein [Nitrososphaerales archaeon]|nr:TIGR00725 family protein [Nitrososphaerales archaeon]
MRQITVIGSGSEVSKSVWDMAEELGRRIAKRRAVLICGGKGGVMEAVCKGAKQEGGLTVGILPGTVDEANNYVDIKIVTEMGDARNAINVKSGDAVIVVCGGAGTLSEIGMALKARKKIVALVKSGGVATMLSNAVIDGQNVVPASSVDEALRHVFE